MRALNRNRQRAFSLIELVIVIVIIGIIGAIAIPRITRGAENADEAALVSDLSVLRNAIDLYAYEHGGNFPTLLNFHSALTQYSNKDASTIQPQPNPGGGVIYGPYLHKIPNLPVGPNGLNEVTTFTMADPQPAPAGDGGWEYDATTGAIRADCAEVGSDGNAYYLW